MAKTLRQFRELYEPKAADEKKFVDKHVVKKSKDQNGNDDKLFKATNIKPVKRATEHGYETVGQHDDEKVYEETQVDEKINLKTSTMGDVIKDFQKSKAPQFVGKSKEKRQQMAIAAKLQAENTDLEEAKVMHRVSVTVSEPDHPMVSKRKETVQKNVRVSADDKKHAEHKATQYYKDRGYKVHGAEHVGMVNEAEKVAMHRPGWMLRKDPKLGEPVKQAKQMNKLMTKFGGKLETGKTVKEESVDESIGMTMSPGFKPWKPSKGKKWKVVHTKTGKVRGEWDDSAGAAKHLKGLTPELQSVHKVVKEGNITPNVEMHAEETKNIVDKSGAVHTPMSRTRHLARMALQKQIQKRDKQVASKTAEKKANEEIDYDAVRDYLRDVYEGRLDAADQQALNEMLETDEGTKLAFIITYYSGE